MKKLIAKIRDFRWFAEKSDIKGQKSHGVEDCYGYNFWRRTDGVTN